MAIEETVESWQLRQRKVDPAQRSESGGPAGSARSLSAALRFLFFASQSGGGTPKVSSRFGTWQNWHRSMPWMGERLPTPKKLCFDSSMWAGPLCSGSPSLGGPWAKAGAARAAQSAASAALTDLAARRAGLVGRSP